MDERFLQRFVQEIVAILEQLGVERIEQLLVDAFGLADSGQLFVDFFEPLHHDVDLLIGRKCDQKLFDPFGQRVLNILHPAIERRKLL